MLRYGSFRREAGAKENRERIGDSGGLLIGAYCARDSSRS
jgi:hypothetical protein